MTEEKALTPIQKIVNQVTKSEAFIAKILPPQSGLVPDGFVRSMRLHLERNPKLADCSTQSVLHSVMFAAEVGLMPGFGNEIHLVPYKTTCVPIVGYNGLKKLGRMSGLIKDSIARIVYEKDEFDIDYSKVPNYIHKPYLDSDPGEIKLVYGVIYFNDGTEKFDWMFYKDVLDIREKSRAKDSGPWAEEGTSDYKEMVKKSMLHRLYKNEILTPQIGKAIEIANRVDSGSDYRDLIDLQPGEYKDIEPPPTIPEINQTAAKSAQPPTERPGRGKPHKEQPQQQQEFIDPVAEIIQKINNGRKELISAFPGEDVWSEICDGQGIPIDADLTKVDYSVLEAIERAVQGSMK
jgi:recombination protein RecT